jgi:hypothetical protein
MTREEIGLTLDRERAVEILLKALGGISACATACKCCLMHKAIAESVLVRYAALTQQKFPRDADQRQQNFD